MSEDNTRTMTPFFTKLTCLLSIIEQTYGGTEIGAYEAESGHCILALCGRVITLRSRASLEFSHH
jgi:hypothetical protein